MEKSSPEKFNQISNHDSESFGIDYEGPVPCEENDNIVVPDINLPLAHNQIQLFPEEFNRNR